MLVPSGDPPAYFTFESMTALGVANATTTRHLPGMETWSSERTVPFGEEAAAALAPTGLALARVAWARQVHGADVVRANAGLAGTADVLVTGERRLPLAIFTADCLAIIACAPRAGAVAVAHVGWRGTVAGAAQAAVRALTGLGARAADVHAAIAPSIGPCCYEVDAPVVERFSSAYPALWPQWFTATSPGHWRLDLWAANEDLLAEAGVARGRIDNPRLCTACRPDLLFSYRKGNRGRLATLAALS
jgi:YfiH family protein